MLTSFWLGFAQELGPKNPPQLLGVMVISKADYYPRPVLDLLKVLMALMGGKLT